MRTMLLTLALLLMLSPLAGCPEQADQTTVDVSATPPTSRQAADPLAAPDAPTDAPADAPAAVVANGADLVGQSAPDFTLTDYNGTTHTLSDYTANGQIVVLEWFDYACGAVKAYYEKADFVAQLNAGLDRDNVVWLSINSAGEGKPGFGAAENIEYMAAHNKSNPVLEDADGSVGHSYGVTLTPTVIVVAADGTVSYFGKFDAVNGPAEAGQGTNLVLAAVESLAAGEPVAVPKNEPFG